MELDDDYTRFILATVALHSQSMYILWTQTRPWADLSSFAKIVHRPKNVFTTVHATAWLQRMCMKHAAAYADI